MLVVSISFSIIFTMRCGAMRFYSVGYFKNMSKYATLLSLPSRRWILRRHDGGFQGIVNRAGSRLNTCQVYLSKNYVAIDIELETICVIYKFEINS